MRKTIFISIALCACMMSACGPSDSEKANQRLEKASQMVEMRNYTGARLQLDSIHLLYPREVAVRRLAKALNDSIGYIEAKQTLVYSDSLLQILLPEVDPLLKNFRYEKNDQYEDCGKYVHRLLATGSNTSRNFLQTYVNDRRETTVKSYYFGSKRINQQMVILACGEEEASFEGTSHAFEAEGWHEILTIENDKALELLNFVASHMQERIRVTSQGEKSHERQVYYLQENEKMALTQTYQLGILMKDIRQLEENIRISNLQIQKYEQPKSLR